MQGWHQLHVRVVLYFSEDGGPSGEKQMSSLDTPVSRQLRGRQLSAPGLLCTNRLYVEGQLKSCIHMNNAT